MSLFEPFPKIPRLNRPVIVSEKIDGTNAGLFISDEGEVQAQSRNRLIFPGDDNAGFAAWVAERASELVAYLGPGRHFGEWWGRGIQRSYGLDERRFSLFNTHRWSWINGPYADREQEMTADDLRFLGIHAVPVLGQLESLADRSGLNVILDRLRRCGSEAAPGFDRPEGVVLFHGQSQHVYKVLLENDETPKGLVDA